MTSNLSTSSFHMFDDDGFDLIPVKPARVYLLQAHPGLYNLSMKLATRREDTWRLPVLLESMSRGDVVILWQGGPQAGIYGIATAMGEPFASSRPLDHRRRSRFSSCGLNSIKLRYIYTLPKPLLETTLTSHKAFRSETVICRGVSRVGHFIEQGEWKIIYRILKKDHDTKYDTTERANTDVCKNLSGLDEHSEDENFTKTSVQLNELFSSSDPSDSNFVRLSRLQSIWQPGYDRDFITTNGTAASNPFNIAPEVNINQLIQRLVDNPVPDESAAVYELVKVRGAVQQLFARLMHRIYDNRCAFCGFSIWTALEAAHIKPWAMCTPAERILPSNGLLLCAVHHKLFDTGVMTLTDGHYIQVIAPKSIPFISKADEQNTISLHGSSAFLPKDKEHYPAPRFLNFRKNLLARLYETEKLDC